MSRKKKRAEEKKQLHPRVMISGYYGFDNLGDELILETLVQELKSQGFRITVLSASPKKTAEKYGVDALDRLSLLAIIEELARCHLFISGGGGLFQDVTGAGSVFYYGGLIHLARFFEVPVVFWGQGVGPLRSPLSRWFTARSLNFCHGITVRDEGSADLVEKLTGERPDVTADPVWLLKVPGNAGARKKVKTWNVGISLRPWQDLTEERITKLARFFRRLTEDSDRPVRFYLLPFQAEADHRPLARFEEALKAEGLDNCKWASPDNIIEGITKCHVLFGMRFHSLVLGILAKIPVYGLVYDPKVRQLLDGLNLQGCDITGLDSLDEESVREYFDAYLEPNLRVLQEQAALNMERLLEVYHHDVENNLIRLEDSL